ncbi:MAG: type IX secretion system protein PorQ [Bacteroidetes bacterium]|nr:type IX secretion system protein PorQ [Bacteroidota bacterium]
MKKSLLLLNLVFSVSIAFGQIGGDAVYTFLELAQSARVSALGGDLITVYDDDVNLAMSNPATLNPEMHTQLGFNHNFHFGKIQNGYASFGWHKPAWGDLTFHAGMQYVSYGTFDETDIYGTVQGEFKAADYALTIGAGKKLYERLSVGANLKVINSQYAEFDSWGLATDIGAMFYDTASNFIVTLVARNAGVQINNFHQTREALPFDLQLGVSKRLEHLPFRLSVTYHHLNQWNILYDDPELEEDFLFFGEDSTDTSRPGVDNFFRHFVFSGEFLLGANENLRLRVGYNHQRKKELSVTNYRSMAGFSLGFGLKISKFRIDYAHSFYHLAGGINHFSISTNLGAFGNKGIMDQ